jgi:hypothetical protein
MPMDIVLDNVETYVSEIDVNFQKDDKNNMMVFINLSLHNPQFTSSKGSLTSKLNVESHLCLSWEMYVIQTFKIHLCLNNISVHETYNFVLYD